MIEPATINPFVLPSVSFEERSQLPTISCIYFVIDTQKKVQYIGYIGKASDRRDKGAITSERYYDVEIDNSINKLVSLRLNSLNTP